MIRLLVRAVTIWLLSIFLITSSVNLALGQTPDPSDRVHDIAKQLNCPSCAGRNLSDCPTDTCMQWKQEIKSQIVAGRSDAEVISYFQDRFGPTVLQEPPREGAFLLIWVLPILACVALIGGVIVVLKRQVRHKAVTASQNQPPVHLDDEYVKRLEDQISSKGEL